MPPESRHPLPDARRSPRARLELDARDLAERPVVRALLDSVDTAILVLNAQREILAANQAALALRGAPDALGLRPGEALACSSAAGPAGCGTSAWCERCGALGAILASQSAARPVEAECLVRRDVGPGAALELNVRATPLRLADHELTVLTLRDISGQKRLEALEQSFLHDALNTVAGLRGWAHVLRHKPEDVDRIGHRIDALSRQLEREILGHRALLAAERGSLSPSWQAVRPADLLSEAESFFSSHPAAQGRTLEPGPAPELELVTDPALVLRVLVNMVCNALEATPPGGRVRLWAERAGEGGARLRVHNQGLIPTEVQARIFQRSFSTKAARGRGLGTHGMKLLGERYLGGAVSFASTEQDGTVFTVELPPAPAGVVAGHRPR